MYEYRFQNYDGQPTFFSTLALKIDQNLIQKYQVNEIVIDILISILIHGSLDVKFYHKILYFIIENISNSEFNQQIREI